MQTTQSAKYTPTPWIVSHDGEGPAIRSSVVEPDWQSYIAQVKESATSNEDRANAARIVQCVNACAEDGPVMVALLKAKELAQHQHVAATVDAINDALRALGAQP